MHRQQVSNNITLLVREDDQSHEDFLDEVRELHTSARDRFHRTLRGEHESALQALEAASSRVRSTKKRIVQFHLMSEDLWPMAEPLGTEEEPADG